MTTIRTLLSIFLLTLLGGAGAQPVASPPDAAPQFEVADIRASPYTLNPFARSDFRGNRYIMRQANLVDLIANAYGAESANVVGGPAWLDIDRYEIYARTPPKTSKDAVKLMLRSLLADRFKLVLTTGTKPLPAFVLSVGKGGPKMAQSDGSADTGCDFKEPPPDQPPGTVQQITFACHNISMASFAEEVHQWAGGYLTSPVVDETGLKGGWDFEIRWTGKGDLKKAGADGISIFDAVDKELGLKLEAKAAPLPVISVVSAAKPTPNIAGIEKLLPPPPPREFDVATIRPSEPDAKMNARINGSQIAAQGVPLQFILTYAYNITDEMLVGAPKWLNTDHFDILAKIAVDPTPGTPQIDMEDLQAMLRKLLEERFKLVIHREDRPIEAYNLVASNPKLKKANPDNRTGCKEGPGDDGKDPRIATPILGRLLTCRNMTMTQFAAQLQQLAGGYVHTPVLDTTGLEGNYDFTISFSTSGQLQTAPGGGGNGSGEPASGAAADPNGALSLPDALSRELGLKMVKVKRPVPVLVIDHVEEKPTEN